MRRSFSSSSKTSSSSLTSVVVGLVIAGALGACGESDGPGNGPPPGGGTPETACNAAAVEPGLDEPPIMAPQSNVRKAQPIDGSPHGRLLDALWLHRSRADRIRERPSLTAGPDVVDIGQIAVVPDEGDLIEPPNPIDLQNLGLRFTRNGAGGYNVTRIDGAFRTSVGSRLMLTDDDSTQLNVPFNFSFYGRVQTTAFINSDGNITFGEGDSASTERNVARLLAGPPRIAVFLADLDPSTAGRVLGNAAADQYTVTWCGIRGFESSQTTNAQITFLPDGSIEMKYGQVTLPDAVVGLSPGRTSDFRPVNLNGGGPVDGGSGAVGERFADSAELDLVEVARKFYRTHADNFDQLVIWTDARLADSFAFETTVANEISGIGLSIFDRSQDFGSAGRLRSLTMMDFIGKYPEDPQQTFLGENNTVSVLGQEVGHRWLAFLEFRNHTGQRSEALLGRDQAHWSFFMDSDASVMEGNDIEDLGGGSFRTVGAVRRYSLLDQYAMGLVPESQVPTFFYVDDPVNVAGGRTASSAPQIGVTFNGTRRDVLIQDVVAINGPRIPAAGESPRVHRQAFIFVSSAGRSATDAQVTKLDRIRLAWETFFRQATDGRMEAITALR